jgi:GTP pyrophosphokinase
MTIGQIVKKFRDNHPGEDASILEDAFEFANLAHEGQFRKNGEPYINHPLHTAFILAEIKADLPTVTAGILHDVPEDTPHGLEEIEALFGAEVASLVKGVTKLGKLKYRGIERYRENLKKMFLAMTSDLRVIFIKFCDRLHNLRTLENLRRKSSAASPKKPWRYMPRLPASWNRPPEMANGNLCFKYLYPDKFHDIEYKYEVEKKIERNRFFQKIKDVLIPRLEEAGISYEIEARFNTSTASIRRCKRKTSVSTRFMTFSDCG